jgi:hypothetical protein
VSRKNYCSRNKWKIIDKPGLTSGWRWLQRAPTPGSFGYPRGLSCCLYNRHDVAYAGERGCQPTSKGSSRFHDPPVEGLCVRDMQREARPIDSVFSGSYRGGIQKYWLESTVVIVPWQFVLPTFRASGKFAFLKLSPCSCSWMGAVPGPRGCRLLDTNQQEAHNLSYRSMFSFKRETRHTTQRPSIERTMRTNQ